MSSDWQPLPPGCGFTGKWNGGRYRLERLLGRGANGQVYLAQSDRAGKCAVKLGMEAPELQGEANILARLDRAERDRAPLLLDVDDAQIGERVVPFYSMPYRSGLPVREFIARNGSEWLSVVGWRLLDRLARLHEAGFAFGDLKNDNVLVGDYGAVELIDYGGVTEFGRGIRQYTEMTDRGFWAAGSRIADPAYDWFAAAVLWIEALDGKRLGELLRKLPQQGRQAAELLRLVRTNALLAGMEPWFAAALTGGFRDTRQAAAAWRAAIRAAHRAGRAGRDNDRVPLWMAALLALGVALCVSAAAVLWLL